MRLTWASTVELIFLWALIGLLPAIIYSIRLDNGYMAEAEVALVDANTHQPATANQVREAASLARAVSDQRLARLIDVYDLYRNDGYLYGSAYFAKPLGLYHFGRPKRSMDDAVAAMRRAIRIGVEPAPHHGLIWISFAYSNAPVAAQVTNQLAGLMMDDNNRKSSSSVSMRITDPARIPERPFRPNRPEIAMAGAWAGAIVGLLISLLRRPPLQLAS